jgi:ankyrin repeat protein/thiol-disulfide isomerase/thioredoxin
MNRRLWLVATLFWGALAAVSALDFEALGDTIQNNDLAAFQRLLMEPGAQKALSKDGLTPYQVACAGAPVSFVQYLVGLGADVNAPVVVKEGTYSDFNGFTPLTLAAWGGNLDVLKFLESRGADINHVSQWSATTAMDIACREGNLNVVKYLFGRIPNKTISGTYTHLSWALNFSTPAKRAVAQFLIESGVDLNADPPSSSTAAHYAVEGSSPEIFQMMLTRNVDWERTDQWGTTPLMDAAVQWPNGLKALLAKGVSLGGYSSFNHFNALESAIKAGNTYSVQMLIDAGADPLAPNPTTGLTPLQLAQSLKQATNPAIMQGSKRVILPPWTLADEVRTGLTYLHQNQGDLALTTLTGQKTKLSAYRGKIVLLNIWATWCPPCITEMPSLQAFSAEYRSKNVVVLGQSVDVDPATAANFASANGLTFPLFTANMAFTNGGGSAFPSAGIPTTYVIDRNGYVVQKLVGSRDWSSPDLRRYIEAVMSQ